VIRKLNKDGTKNELLDKVREVYQQAVSEIKKRLEEERAKETQEKSVQADSTAMDEK
jgi:hypothetical protein